MIGSCKHARQHSANRMFGVRWHNTKADASDDVSGQYLSVFMVDHYVVWLDVSMHNSHTVAVVQSLRDTERTDLTQTLTPGFSHLLTNKLSLFDQSLFNTLLLVNLTFKNKKIIADEKFVY